MRTVQRNMQKFWYRLYSSVTPIYETGAGYGTVETGEYKEVYSAPVAAYANISPASGASVIEQFGNLDNYDKVLVTTDLTCQIDEHSVLYIGITPTQDEVTKEWSAYNYVVRRVARALNHISIAVRKVDVS